MKLERVEIKGFKSIKHIVIDKLTPLSVFAGANGSGKSNLMDALSFISSVLRFGVDEAVIHFGGYWNIKNRHLTENECLFFSVTLSDRINNYQYEFSVGSLSNANSTDIFIQNEKLLINSSNALLRFTEMYDEMQKSSKDEKEQWFTALKNVLSTLTNTNTKQSKLELIIQVANQTAHPLDPILEFLKNISVYRFSPEKLKSPQASKSAGKVLLTQGENLVEVLELLLASPEWKEEIIETMSMIVPEMVGIDTQLRRIDNSKALHFKEHGFTESYPANLISEGTVMSLALLVAVYTRFKQPGITIIEEPERGINPQALKLLIEIINDHSSEMHYFILTTHSETIVRQITPENLWFASKSDGQTKIENIAQTGYQRNDIPLDEAWLTGLLGGGLPW